MMSRINEKAMERLPSVLNQIQRFSLVVGVPLAFGGWLYAAPIITTFYGDTYLEAARIFRVLMLSFAVETAVMGIGPALAATNRMKLKLYIDFVGAAAVISLSIVFIPPFGPIGAAYAFLISRVVCAVLSVFVTRRHIAPLQATSTLGKSIFAGSVMTLVLVAVPGLSLWTGVAVGAVVYFAVLLRVRGMSSEDRIVLWNAIRGAFFQ
jgi:O-antigen/teichoic acid export membrane protein